MSRRSQRFARAVFVVDKGIKHTHKRKRKVKRHGKLVTETVTITTYTSKAIATRLPTSKHFSFKDLKPGLHTTIRPW